MSSPLLYLVLRGSLEPFWANAVALVATAVANTAANRRITFGCGAFGRRGPPVAGVGDLRGRAGGHLRLPVDPAPAQRVPRRSAEITVLTSANLVVTLMRFLAMRLWVFHRTLKS
jgi:hypothetical protein